MHSFFRMFIFSYVNFYGDEGFISDVSGITSVLVISITSALSELKGSSKCLLASMCGKSPRSTVSDSPLFSDSIPFAKICNSEYFIYSIVSNWI